MSFRYKKNRRGPDGLTNKERRAKRAADKKNLADINLSLQREAVREERLKNMMKGFGLTVTKTGMACRRGYPSEPTRFVSKLEEMLQP